jgi:predicted Zn-dependent protease
MNNFIRFAAILSILAVLVYGCATVPITGRKQLVLVSEYELDSLSRDSYQKIITESKLSGDKKKTELVKKVGTRIADSAEDFLREKGKQEKIKYFSWEFNLIDDEVANAFAMPGGKVAVYSGILKYTQDEKGLAVVIAHEIGHVIANHGGERMSQMLLAQFGHDVLSKALNEKSQTTQEFLMLAYGVTMNLGVVLPYSRLHEKEADRIGLVLMARAGYDPHAAVSFWERMQNSRAGNELPEFLSTHPVAQTRINEIKDNLPEAMQYYK